MFKVECLKERIAITILLMLLAAVTATGQRGGTAGNGGSVRPERAAIDRPSPGTSAQTVTPGECDSSKETCPGDYSFVYGFNAKASPRHGGAQSEQAGFAFNVYVTRRIFLEFDNDNVVSTKTEPAPRVTGFGDTTVYVGADAILDKKGQPGISFAYGVKAPTADSNKGLGSGKVDHTLLGIVSKTLGSERPRPTYLEFDIGDYIAGRTGSSGFDHFPFGSIVLKQWLDGKKKYRLHAEVGGSFATSKSNAELYTLEYVETKLSEHFALRTGGRFGLTPNVSRAGLYLGLRVKGNLKEIF